MLNYDETIMTSGFVNELLKSTIALFIIVDPVGNLPIFIGLTDKMPKNERKKVFHTAISVGLVLLLVFAFAGQQVLIMFGISFDSFMIAGGALLFIIAMKILVSGGWEEREVSPESVGAVPIAFPLLVGPGAITATMVSLQTAGLLVTVVSVLIIFGLLTIILNYIDLIYAFLGKTGAIVVARVMAIFLAAIAVGFIVQASKVIFQI